MENFSDLKAPQILSLDLLEENQGQYLGLPANPRTIRDEKFELLKKNIQEHPEFLRYNALKVFPMDDGHYIIIGGNMRYKAMVELGVMECPCIVIDPETPVEDLKAYVILDNSPFGQWEWQMLQGDEWDADQLHDWGVESDFLSDDFFVDEEPDNGSLDDYKEPEKDYLECPHCHHVDSKVHFKKVASSSGANEKADNEASEEEQNNEDLSFGD